MGESGKGRSGDPRPKKIEAVSTVVSMLKESGLYLLVDLSGVPVKANQALRAQFRKTGSQCKVVKNSLIAKGLKELGREVPESALKGPTALVSAGEDLVAPAKVLNDFIKEQEELSARKAERNQPWIKAGYMGDQAMDMAEITRLARLPSREALLAQAAGLMQAPVQKTAFALSALLSSTARAFGALLQQKEKAA